MAYITTPGFAGIDLTETGATKLFPLGLEVQGSDGNTYMYVQADKNLNTGQAVYILESGATFAWVTTNNNPSGATNIAFPQGSLAQNNYGWVVVKGINFLSDMEAGTTSADTKIYSDTANAILTGANTGELIQGLRANAAGAGASEISASSAGYTEINAQT